MFHLAALSMALAQSLGAKPPAEPKTHDYTVRHWGHDYAVLNVINGGARLRASGWGLGISVGDHLLLENEQESSRYRVDAIEYRRDPADMWFADLSFAPRKGA